MITEEQIAKLKEANPGAELSKLRIDDLGIDVVVRTGDDRIEGLWKRFRSQASDDAQRAGALRGLVFGCVVHPPDFASLVARKPGLIETVGGKIVDLVGVSLSVTVEKL